MKGLLCKDWAIFVNGYKKNFLIMVVLYLGMAVCLHMNYLCYALVAVCGVYASSTMNFDDFAHWDTYARTLPVTPGQVVGCKYLLGLLFTLFGSVCAAVGIFLAGQYTDVLEAAFSILVIAAFSLLLFAVNMPFSYKFGAGPHLGVPGRILWCFPHNFCHGASALSAAFFRHFPAGRFGQCRHRAAGAFVAALRGRAAALPWQLGLECTNLSAQRVLREFLVLLLGGKNAE